MPSTERVRKRQQHTLVSYKRLLEKSCFLCSKIPTVVIQYMECFTDGLGSCPNTVGNSLKCSTAKLSAVSPPPPVFFSSR